MLKFKTSINCGKCKATVTPFINSIEGITSWSVDIDNPDKILTIEGEGIKAENIFNCLAETGFSADLI